MGSFCLQNDGQYVLFHPALKKKKSAKKHGSFEYMLLMHNLTVNSYNFLLCAAESDMSGASAV